MISGVNDSPISLRFISQGSSISSNAPEDSDCLNPEGAISSLDEKQKRDQLSIEKLDSCIKHYGAMYSIRMKIYNAVTGLVSAQSLTYSTAGTASVLATAANPASKSPTTLMNASTSLTTFVNVLTLGIQLYLSCKSRVTWKRALKLRKHLENPSAIPLRQIDIESEEIRKVALKKISSFIHLSPDLLAKTFARSQKEKNILSSLHGQKDNFTQLSEEKQNLQKHLERLANHLFEHLAQESEKWQALQQVVEQEASPEQKLQFQEITQKGDSYKALQVNRKTLQEHILAPAIEKTSSSQTLDKRAGILGKIAFLLQETAKIEEGREKLKDLGLLSTEPLSKKELETLILANAHKIKSLAVNAQNTYMKKLLRTIHIDLDRLQATTHSEESMQQVLEKQKEKAQKNIQHLQSKIELILQSPKIYKILSSPSSNKKEQLKQILPNLSIPDEVKEHLLIPFVDKLLSDHKTGFNLKELAVQEVQGHDLRVTKERLDYLSKVLGIVIFSQENQKLKSAIENDLADVETISQFSKELAKKAFGHQTALEQSVKNGLQALAAQKLRYAMDLEGGKWTKPASLFVRGVYLFSSLATCICLPLMATGILTIPAAALLIFSKVLYLITTISLGSGLAYWRKNAPHTFKQSQKEFLSNASENLLWIKDRIKMIFGYDLKRPTEFDLLSKKRTLLIQKRTFLILQSAITDLSKKIIQTESIQEKTTAFSFSKNITSEELLTKVALLQKELTKTQDIIERIQSTLSNWEKLYANQHPSGISDMQKARIKDMSESTLKRHLVNPIKLAFASLFEETKQQTANTKALALSDVITKMCLENTLPTELELLFEALGMSIEDIKVQVETERLKKDFLDTDKIEKQVKAEVEQALGQFFGGALEQITHTDQLGLEIFNKALTE